MRDYAQLEWEHGQLSLSALETGLPSTQGQGLSGGSVGFAYASFLLGLVDSASINAPQDPQLRKQSLALFVQDTWKVTRTSHSTTACGGTVPSRVMSSTTDEFIRASTPTLLPVACWRHSLHGLCPGRCNCNSFSKNVPVRLGPRLGSPTRSIPRLCFEPAGVSVRRDGEL